MMLPYISAFIVFASNMNYVVITMQSSCKNVFLIMSHTWECICELSFHLPSNTSWKHPLYFRNVQRNYDRLPHQSTRPSIQIHTQSKFLVLVPKSRNSYKGFQNSVMTKILSSLALSNKKKIPCFSLQRLLLKCKATRVVVSQKPLGCN